MPKSPFAYYKFCPRCGSRLFLEKGESQPELVCARRDFTFYQNPHAAVAALVFNGKSEIMLVKRKYSPCKGTWDIPGGFVDWDEDPETAIAREVREEVGMRFTPKKLFSVYHDWYDFRGLRVSVYITCFTGTLHGKPIPHSDVASIRWFSLNKLPQHIAFPYIRKALRDFRKQ